MINAQRRRWLKLMLGAVLGSLGPAQADEAAPVAFLKYVFTPFEKETARLEGAKKFVAGVRESIVFTNESDGVWRFGLVPGAPGRLAGSLQVQRLKGEDASLEPVAILVGDSRDQPVVINARFSTIVVTPIQPAARDHAGPEFHRVCYLQDSTGRRVVFSLHKGAPGTGMPRLGFVDQNKSLAEDLLRLSPNGDNLFLIAREKLP